MAVGLAALVRLTARTAGANPGALPYPQAMGSATIAPGTEKHRDEPKAPESAQQPSVTLRRSGGVGA